jgi:transcriptional regulator with XRE-family HTH domain
MRRLYGIGKLLKQEIKKCGLKHCYVAQEVGMSRSTLDNYLSDATGIPEPTLRGILAAFPKFDKSLLKKGKENQQRKLDLTSTRRKGATNG